MNETLWRRYKSGIWNLLVNGNKAGCTPREPRRATGVWGLAPRIFFMLQPPIYLHGVSITRLFVPAELQGTGADPPGPEPIQALPGLGLVS
ncbi:hypothetical protein TRICI_004656 [Trichomonascus ciferrii]|uniref:Uncharacterized protein n=1 Tax=Trichomonascus ciferrii TaxID=44093 RepID=A0A642V582_9ASCO|nr:hypothetical protein TRICI_004656 [Trichomonascus ciferrii]